MNTQISLDAAAILKRHHLLANKRLGQNFLQDPVALQNIAAAAMIQPGDSVLEIGAGLGSLTRYLAKFSAEVVAVELDQRLAPILKEGLKLSPNVRLVIGDILKITPGELGLGANYVVAANIPYHITSAIIRHLLENEPRPRRIVLTIQQEVAQRICSSPPDMNLLALSVQVYGKPQVISHVPASAFFPAPKVDSAVVRIEVYDDPVIPRPLLHSFFELSKAGFGQKRKKLRNSLSSGLRIPVSHAEDLLQRANIDPQRRAETLNLKEWYELSDGWFLGKDGGLSMLT